MSSIANAGISVGMDTAVRADLEVMRATFETNNLGLAATFHPFVAPMIERRRGTLVGIASVAGMRGLPGHGAYSASKAGGDRLLREPARRAAAVRRSRRDDRARLHRHAADRRAIATRCRS